MKLLTIEQIRQADAFTIRHEPIASVDLMERAALQLAGWMMKHFPPVCRVWIFAGQGNNGGDGIALARLLIEAGYEVSLWICAALEALSEDARINFHRLPDNPSLTTTFLTEGHPLPEISNEVIIVDAIFGSGLTREPSGFYANLIDHLNASGATIVSVDVPSGLYSDDNRLNSKAHVIRASHTLTFQSPKLAFLLKENHNYTGCWEVLDIQLHPGFTETADTYFHLITPVDIAWISTPRPRHAHKGDFGHALLVAGSYGKMGAAVLAAKAALRIGVGLLTAHVPQKGVNVIQTAIPEAMVDADRHLHRLSEMPDASRFTAVAIGPGIGTNPGSGSCMLDWLSTHGQPVVLDADALNLMSNIPGSLNNIPKNSILTPHPGEFKRLFGEDGDEYSLNDRLRRIAAALKLIIVLKGAYTRVAMPDGNLWFNTLGNPGMATGGSGDVLTGMILGLLAQGSTPEQAALAGVYLHALAGDLAAADLGERSLLAGDLVDYLPQALNNLKKR